MNSFYNEHNSIVTESLKGLVQGNGNSNLEVLDGLPHIKCVFNAQRDSSKVAVLSGGGAGHEPAHAGYVGQGMLTGAISGEIFASPSVDAVLAAILHVTGDAGCLLIVKNYTGDRLNFGLAAERAKNLGLKVEMVIVGDDVSIEQSSQPRGIAGTLFVHKVAGYLAEQGESLDKIKSQLDSVAGQIHSIGVAYRTCDLPGQSQPQNENEEAEMGLGIHGEPGVETFLPSSASDTVEKIVERLMPYVDGRPLAMLVNNLGATSNLEMSVVMNDLIGSALGEHIELIFGPQTYMTALNMHGFSVSILPLTDLIRESLKAPVAVSAWRDYATVGKLDLVPISKALKQDQYLGSYDQRADELIQTVCQELIDSEGHLNELDAKVGDGDTGTTFANGARAVMDALKAGELPMANSAQLLLAIGNHLSTAMGGSSGVLLSIFFTATGNAYRNRADLALALQEGLSMVSRYGGAKLGDRTMLDAAIPAIESITDGGDWHDVARHALVGADSTAQMLNAGAGRSSYLRSDSLAGVKDPGAVAVARIFNSLAAVEETMGEV